MTSLWPGERVILDLCGGTGGWSAPYARAGYTVITVDMGDAATPAVGARAGLVIADVRLWKPAPGLVVHGILAAPPCTHLSTSGARWWQAKGDDALLEALSVVDACVRLVARFRPAWWALENPVGRLSHYLGAPVATFHPWQYGDGYRKRTCLWGSFAMPAAAHAHEPAGVTSSIHTMSPGPDRARKRSVTPAGFADAFYRANP